MLHLFQAMNELKLCVKQFNSNVFLVYNKKTNMPRLSLRKGIPDYIVIHYLQ